MSARAAGRPSRTGRHDGPKAVTSTLMQPLATIPSPAEGVWHLGPFPLRAYALMIILGIVAAVWLGERRWTARGGTPGAVIDVAVWAVPFGLLGGRLYHVLTDWQRYFGEGGDPAAALQIWRGGLGIWGAIALGGVGAWIGCRRRGISVLALGDAVAPGLALAQGIGRWGNWWNQELYGRPLNAWWALEIDPEHRPRLPGTDTLDPRYADVATYHPTFLYESLWCIALAFAVIWAGRRFTLTHGRAFALYVAGYTLGRFWIESLRIDEAHHILGMRLNNWTSLLVFAGAVAYLWWARNRTGPEAVVVEGADADAPAVPAEDASSAAGESRPSGSAAAADRPEGAGGDGSGGDAEDAPAGESGETGKDVRRPESAETGRDEASRDSRDFTAPDAEERQGPSGAGTDADSGTEERRESSGAPKAEEPTAPAAVGERDAGESRDDEPADEERDAAEAEERDAGDRREESAEAAGERDSADEDAPRAEERTAEASTDSTVSAVSADAEEPKDSKEETGDSAAAAEAGEPRAEAPEEAEDADGGEDRTEAPEPAEAGEEDGAGRRAPDRAAEAVKD